MRDALGLDFVPAGVSATGDDNIIYDITDGKSAGGFGHPDCGGKEAGMGKSLPKTHPVGKIK